MKSDKIKQAVITLLACCCVFFAFSHSLLAKPNKPTPSSPPVVINAVNVDYTANTVEVTGSGLDTVSEVLLGGVNVSGTISNSTSNSLTLDLGNATVSPVMQSGNYSLIIDGNTFSVYFSSAIFVDVGATCPCQATWDYFRTANADYPIGFNGLTPYSAYDDGSTVQLIFQDTYSGLTYMWILNSTYTAESKQCDMPVDGGQYGLPMTIDEAQHAACSEYLRDLVP
jgi:hypothetical protein